MNISVSVIEIRNLIEIEEKIAGLKPHQGVIFPPNSFIAAHRARIIDSIGDETAVGNEETREVNRWYRRNRRQSSSW